MDATYFPFFFSFISMEMFRITHQTQPSLWRHSTQTHFLNLPKASHLKILFIFFLNKKHYPQYELCRHIDYGDTRKKKG